MKAEWWWVLWWWSCGEMTVLKDSVSSRYGGIMVGNFEVIKMGKWFGVGEMGGS